MRLPWKGGAGRHAEAEHRQVAAGAFEQEREAFERDIEQIKRLNEYLLNRAVAAGRISEETAAAIRTTQSYENEVLDIGSDPHHQHQA